MNRKDVREVVKACELIHCLNDFEKDGLTICASEDPFIHTLYISDFKQIVQELQADEEITVEKQNTHDYEVFVFTIKRDFLTVKYYTSKIEDYKEITGYEYTPERGTGNEEDTN